MVFVFQFTNLSPPPRNSFIISCYCIAQTFLYIRTFPAMHLLKSFSRPAIHSESFRFFLKILLKLRCLHSKFIFIFFLLQIILIGKFRFVFCISGFFRTCILIFCQIIVSGLVLIQLSQCFVPMVVEFTWQISILRYIVYSCRLTPTMLEI